VVIVKLMVACFLGSDFFLLAEGLGRLCEHTAVVGFLWLGCVRALVRGSVPLLRRAILTCTENLT
jgi:hypothetical protein